MLRIPARALPPALPARAALVAALVGAALAGCTSQPNPAPSSTARSAAAPPTPTLAPLVGDPGWGIRSTGEPDAIEGWADHTSGVPGDPLGLHVSTTAASYTVTAYRMGSYGSERAAKVWSSQTLPGTKQAAPTRTAGVNTVQTSWPVSLTVPTADWRPGHYLLRLDTNGGDSAAGGAAQRFVAYTVRNRDMKGRVVLVTPVTTWQAYNTWGGYSLYHGPKGTTDFENRSRAVSFDRPYEGDGAADFVEFDLPEIAHAEQLGIPLGYATDIDLHEQPDLLDGARAVVSMGHDEYWSTAMRKSVTAARDRGVNLAFLGANAVFRHVRFAPTSTGPDRLMICYKRTSDPLFGVDNKEVTVDWREPPLSDPESSLTGAFYESNPVDADMVISNPGNWLFEGTGATAGMKLPHMVGSEYDRVNPGAPTPQAIEVLTHSPLVCRGVHSYGDSAYYTVASGAGVYASGTLVFAHGLPEGGASGVTAQVIGGLYTNLLLAFAAGPAGESHPARRNVEAFHEYAGDPIADGHDS